jgi:5-methylcytosine-specific restriction protein A
MPQRIQKPCAHPGCPRTQDFATKMYESKEWRRLRKEVLKADRYECQVCKGKGYYTKATVVHHINYLKVHPELALETHYKDDDRVVKRNLISLCHLCHEHIHEWLVKEKEEPLTIERW